MQRKVINLEGQDVGSITLDEKIFNVEFKPIVVKEVIDCQQSNDRQATYGTKNRDRLIYSTKKLRKQKGSGRARVGPRGAPQYRHGAVVFGPDGRKYTMSVPKTKRNKVLAMCLTKKLQNNEIIFVDSLEFKETKTKKFVEICSKLELGKYTLFIDANKAEKMVLSMRNVPCYNFLQAIGINPLSLIRSSKVVMTTEAVKILGDRYESK